MKKFSILTLILLCGVSGQGSAQNGITLAKEGIETIVRTSDRTLLTMQQLSAEALQFNGTLTALVANTDFVTSTKNYSFEQALNNTWAARAEAALVWKSPALNVEDAAQILLNKKPLSELSAPQQQNFYLVSYPALILEGPFVADPQQLSYALAYYRNILAEKPVKATLPQALKDWARSMAAVTDLGLLGTPNDVFLILQNAKKPFPPKVTPWTDLITVQALLQYEAYDAIEELAKFRMNNQGTTHSELLHSYWHHIADYLNNIGHPLSIKSNQIAGYFSQTPMPAQLQRLLAQYNPYNLFYVKPSAKVYDNGLALRQNFLQKNPHEQFLQDEDLTRLLTQQLDANLRQDIVVRTPSQPQSSPNNTGFSRYNNQAIWQTDPLKGYEQLTRRALHDCAVLRQKIELKQVELNENLSPYRAKTRAQLELELADLQRQYQEAEARLHQLNAEHLKKTPIDQISYLLYNEPLKMHESNMVSFSTRFDAEAPTPSLGLLSFFQAPVSSREEANLKQALLDYAENNVRLAKQATRNTDDPEAQGRYQSAADKLAYIYREVAAGAPYEIIVVNAYGVSADETGSALFEIPPMPYRFEGQGRYASFEAPVKDKSDGEAKQNLFNNLYQNEADLQQQIVIYQYEIRALRRNTQLLGRHARARKLATYQAQLADAQEKLAATQQQIEQVLQQIQQGVPFETISESLR